MTTRKPRSIANKAAWIRVSEILPRKEAKISKEAGISSYKGLIWVRFFYVSRSLFILCLPNFLLPK